MKGKKGFVIFTCLLLILSVSGCGVLSDDFFEETYTYGQRDAEDFTTYLQGMGKNVSPDMQTALEKKFADLPQWQAEASNSEVDQAWIQFEEELRRKSIPIGYADVESFLETEKASLGEQAYQRALELLMEWYEIPEEDEANVKIEGEMDQILAKLDVTFSDLVSMVNDKEAVLGIYRVQNSQLNPCDPIWLAPMRKSNEQEDIVLQIWARVQCLIPEELLSRVVEFAAVTDGEDQTMAYVYPVEEDLKTWRLTVDYLDFLDAGGQVSFELADETLLHEFGHILSLNETQMDPEVIGTLQLEEGSLGVSSYLNRFYQRFWRKYEAEQAAMQAEGASEEASFDFYLAHETEFLNDYAATSVAEDFAESFAQFILRDQPSSAVSGADEKIIFFYQFSELVKMRTQIQKEVFLLEEAA